MLLAILHARLANAVVVFMLIAGVWGLWSYFRRQPVSASYLGTLVIGELLIAAQVLAGILLYLQGARAVGIIHYLYGFLALIALPAAFAYVRGAEGRRESMVYGLVSLFIFGLAIRGIITAGSS
jgi:heme A synthase